MALDADMLVVIVEDYTAVMEFDRVRWENTKNPLYVWHTIGMCFTLGAMQTQVQTGKLPSPPPGTEPYPIPSWCLAYLGIVAFRIEALSDRKDFRLAPMPFGEVEATSESWSAFKNITPTLNSTEGAQIIPQALGIQRPGWNAFERFTSLKEKELDAFSEEALRFEGKTPNQTMEILMEEANISDPRAMRRRISDARNAGREKKQKPTP